MTDIEDAIIKVLDIYKRSGQKVTETDIVVWYKGQYSVRAIQEALRKLEDERRVVASSETYWWVVK